MDYFRRNQDKILNPEHPESLAQTIQPLVSKRTPKAEGYYDILIRFKEKLFVVKHVKLAPLQHLFPLDFSDAFVLNYEGTVDTFKKESQVLKESDIEQHFNYILSNPEQLNMLALGIMTSFPFMDDITTKMKIHLMGKIGRNDPCPCGSGKKYKNCCME
jgi:preprotein translocase subunit SecA